MIARRMYQQFVVASMLAFFILGVGGGTPDAFAQG